MQIHLHIIGVLLVLLALLHIAFPKRFEWKRELESTSLLTQQIMYVHTFFIGLVVFLMGILSLFFAQLLIEEKLGSLICSGLAIFWFFRLIIQLFVYSPQLWRGKLFETVVHIVFTLMWLYFTSVFTWVALG